MCCRKGAVLFTIYLLLRTACSEKQLWVTEGDSVVLPCLLPRPFLPLNEMTGYWATKDTHQEEEKKEKKENGVIFSSGEEKLVEEREQLVHFFDKGKEEFTHQSPSYINRTRLFSSQLQAGNFSLELRNVSERDNNTTFQFVVSHNNRLCNVTVLVKMREDDDVDQSAAPLANSWMWYIGIAAFGLLVLLVLVAVVYKKRNPALPNPNTGLCCVRMLV
ncbi:uncharacterized protein LOC116222987 [Clupea harengus]|uniref:Uncharacterized protein LOC116222987 n=1 Tax=Clupea harengus TaxID=7950 RepID=A0A6P8GC22_CLUHA|nr:uncharacterized protein LOC116222987 [Clupea harengus]